MHAAVWSQPISRSKLRRCHSESETPHSAAGKTVLGIGIFLTLFGGLLVVLGITGYFVRGGNKYHLGYGVPDGVLTLLTGLCGTRSVSRRTKARQYATIFALLTLLTTGSSAAMVVLSSAVLSRPSQLLLTAVIGVGETAIASLAAVLCIAGLGVTVNAKFRLAEPPSSSASVPEDSDLHHHDLSPPHCELGSPEASLSLVSDIRARI